MSGVPADGPLAGKRVLITRPQHQAGALAEKLTVAGAEAIVAPAIEITPPDDPAAALAAASRVHEYHWLVFTSRNGVDAFFDVLAASGRDARAFGATRVAAIGPGTAEAFAARGLRVDLVPDAFIGEAVGNALLERSARGDRMLLFRAQAARDVVERTLRDRGRIVDVVAGYATRPIADPSYRRHVAAADVVTFASASAVRSVARNVFDLAALAATKVVACVGPVTADAARNAGLRVDVVAEAHTIDGLVDALAAHLTAAAS